MQLLGLNARPLAAALVVMQLALISPRTAAAAAAAHTGLVQSRRSRSGRRLRASGAEDVEVFLKVCEFTSEDLAFWRLTQSAYLIDGIVLPRTIAYTESCDKCEYNNVECRKEEARLEDGNCLCMWRVNGKDPVTSLLQCGACVEECIGKFKNFDLGKDVPETTGGLCLRKKDFKLLPP
mmetsp:Transcript_132426/g.247649  ORF Transcript_132426/g.247649 Transcript_132426/m.247649 type:complete len:179 (+) Transcript_132426:46-582(+)